MVGEEAKSKSKKNVGKIRSVQKTGNISTLPLDIGVLKLHQGWQNQFHVRCGIHLLTPLVDVHVRCGIHLLTLPADVHVRCGIYLLTPPADVHKNQWHIATLEASAAVQIRNSLF
jgi:hypothetical protein